MERIPIKDILLFLEDKFQIIGNNENLFLSDAKSIFDASHESITWINSSRNDANQLIEDTNANAIICSKDLAIDEEWKKEKCFILVENPRLSFLRIIKKFFSPKIDYSIHPTAFIHNEAEIHSNTYIGAFTYIGKCVIGEGTIIYGNCNIYDNTKIGKNVIINSGTVIGADGFGYSRNEKNELEKFPHIGGVVIEDEVEIGANTCIDKGTLGNTILKKGAKIDNLIHIAHNVIIGEHTAVIAQSIVGGSTEIGSYTWIAPAVCIRDGIKIGNKVTVGMGAVVTKNIPDNETWAGSPARPIEELKEQIKKINQL